MNFKLKIYFEIKFHYIGLTGYLRLASNSGKPPGSILHTNITGMNSYTVLAMKAFLISNWTEGLN